MKNVFFATLILASSVSFAAPGIGRFEQKQMLPRQVAEMTGLQQQDSRYAQALANCAKNDAAEKNQGGVVEFFETVVNDLTSDEYKNASSADQKQYLTLARIEIKVLCSAEINALEIDP